MTEIEINDADIVDKNVKYEINATYWVKLPKPTVGAHFIELSSDIDAISGVQIIAVVKGSPAAIAGILRNDSITSIAEQTVNNPEDLIGAIKKNKGKLIEVSKQSDSSRSKVFIM